MDRFLASLMKKKTKTEDRFKNEKKSKKRRRYLFSLRVELKIFHDGRGVLKNRFNEKKEDICFR